MPLFGRKSDDEKRLEAEQQQHRLEERALSQASLEALAAGRIPVQAQRRLEALRTADRTLFTSDLSVNEFLLARKAGLRPLSQVMGSSMYHVGWRRIGFSSSGGEIASVTHALNEVRLLALRRLGEEARLVEADVVIGVRLKRLDYDWASDVIEFSAVGTAMALEQGGRSGLPALTNLSGQDFWKLYEHGYWPVGVVGGSSVLHVVPSYGTWRANNSFYGGLWNQELTDFSGGVYAARHRASGRMQQEAAALSAEGIVGVTIQQETQDYEVNLGNDQERTDMIVTFQTLGTAIVELPGRTRSPTIFPLLNLTS